MARAKRTHRAEARRRYRSEQALGVPSDAVEARQIPAAQGQRCRSSSTGTAGPSTTPSRWRRQRVPCAPCSMRVGPARPPAAHPPSSVVDPGRDALTTTILFIVIIPRWSILGVVTVFLYQSSSSRRRSAACSSPDSSRRAEAGCSGCMVGIVAAACASFLVLRGFIGIAPTAETQQLAGDVILASFLLSPLVARSSHRPRPGIAGSVPLQPRSRPGRGSDPSRPDGRSRSSSQKGLSPPLAGPSQGAAPALSPAFASPRGPSAGRRSAARARRPPARVGRLRTSRATGFHGLQPHSRCSSPSTSSNACRRTTPRSRSQVDGQS